MPHGKIHGGGEPPGMTTATGGGGGGGGASMVQVLLQPSPFMRFPSSHSSPGSKMKFPHAGSRSLTIVMPIVVWACATGGFSAFSSIFSFVRMSVSHVNFTAKLSMNKATSTRALKR